MLFSISQGCFGEMLGEDVETCLGDLWEVFGTCGGGLSDVVGTFVGGLLGRLYGKETYIKTSESNSSKPF